MNVVVASMAAAVAAGYLFLTSRILVPGFGGPVNAKVFPTLVGFALLAAAGLLLLENRRRSKASLDRGVDASTGAPAEPAKLRLIGGVVAWTLVYFALFEWAGFVLSTAVYLSALMAHFHRGNRLAACGIAVGFTVVMYGILSWGLGVPLPRGALF